MRNRIAILEQHGLRLREHPDGDPQDGAARWRARIPRLAARPAPGDHPVGHVLRVRGAAHGAARPPDVVLPFARRRCRSDKVRDYRLRIQDGKAEGGDMTLKLLNFGVVAAGDSYSDTSMLGEAECGILFCPARQRRARIPGSGHAHLRRAAPPRSSASLVEVSARRRAPRDRAPSSGIPGSRPW